MKEPNLDQWRLFVQIAELGSLTETAAARDVAQPALSRQLAAIERACGGRLFDRAARGLRLNAAGQQLYPRVLDWLRGADALVADARGALRAPAGVVRLGVLASFEPALVGGVFRALREGFPAISLQVTAGLSGHLSEAVQAGTLDLALLSTNSREHHRQEIPIGRVEHVLVGAPGDALTHAATVPFARLDRLPLVVPGRAYPFHQMLEHWAVRRRITLQVVAECDALELQKHLVATERIHAIMAAGAVRQDCVRGTLQAARVVEPVLVRNIVLRTTPARPLTPAGREVLRIVERTAQALLAPAG